MPFGGSHSFWLLTLHGRRARVPSRDHAVDRAVAAATKVEQTSNSAVARVSKPADDPRMRLLPIWESAIRQVWKPAFQLVGEAAFALLLLTPAYAQDSQFLFDPN